MYQNRSCPSNSGIYQNRVLLTKDNNLTHYVKWLLKPSPFYHFEFILNLLSQPSNISLIQYKLVSMSQLSHVWHFITNIPVVSVHLLGTPQGLKLYTWRDLRL